MGDQGFLFEKPQHGKNLEELRLSAKFSDVSIKTKNKVYRAHRVVLYANLNYFKSAFDNLPGGNQQVVLYLRSFKAEAVEPFLTLAYTGQMLLTDRNVVMILEQAFAFKENDVAEACIKYLQSHLKPEQACKVFEITKKNKCLPLQRFARSIILKHFEDCSKTQDFLDFNYQDLTDVLTQAILNNSVSHRVLFDRVILWILHNSKDRQIHIYRLLDPIDISTEPSEKSLLKGIDKSKEDHISIAKDVIYCYHKQIEKKKHDCLLSEHRNLMAVSIKLNGNLQVQYYSLFLEKWCEPREFINPHKSMTIESGLILKNKFYNLIVDKNCQENIQVQLVEFNMSTRPNAMLYSSSELLRSSGMCASSNCIYLCGGQYRDGSVSDRIVRFNPQTKVFKSLSPMPTKRCNATATFGKGRLYVLGGCNESGVLLNSVEMYDINTKEWSELAPLSKPREGFAAAVLENKLYIAGGMKLRNGRQKYSRSVKVYNPSSRRWQSVESMPRNRYKFVMIGYLGKLMTVGGELGVATHETVEVYDPNEDEWQEDSNLCEDLKLKRPIIGMY